jgi:hypothetical protein
MLYFYRLTHLNGSVFENHYQRKKILDHKIIKLGKIIKNTREKNKFADEYSVAI